MMGAARTPMSERSCEHIQKLMPSNDFVSNGRDDEWLDEKTADAVRAKIKEQIGPKSLTTVEDIFSAFDL